jgi:hypothetical protein
MESFLVAGLWLCAGACGYIGYDPLEPPCRGAACESGRDPAQPGDGDGDRAGDGDGDDDGPWDGDGTPGDGEGDRDGGDDWDGDDGATQGPELPCGSIQGLQESFDDGLAAVGWVERWYDGASLRLRNDRLEMDLGGSPGGAATYRTSQVFDLRDSELTLAMKPGGEETAIALREGALERVDAPVFPLRGGVALRFSRGRIQALRLDGDAELVGASGDYDAEADRFVRIREAAGTIHWETSPDRVAWTELYSRATPMDASAVRVELYARGQGPEQLAWFDDLNVPAAGVARRCPPGQLHDDFDDGRIALVWKRWFGAGSCSVEERNGRVELSLGGTPFAMCGLVSSSALDFRDASLSFSLDPGAQSTGVAAFADLSHFRLAGITDRIEVRVVNERVRMRITRKPSPAESEVERFSAELAYEASEMQYLRLRESNGRIHWEASPEGVNWSLLAESPTAIDVSSVIIGLSAVKVEGVQAAQVRYDDVAP